MGKVCGLNVHKGNVFACIMNEKGEKNQKKFGVLTSELDSLRDLLVCNDVGEVVMESTNVYWTPISMFNFLVGFKFKFEVKLKQGNRAKSVIHVYSVLLLSGRF